MPQLDGAIEVAGLKAPVEVSRDARGVPHIRARSLEDAVFAQGYVTAQDRLWQMDVSRRLARGELSEILGKRTLELDIENRKLGLAEAADRAVREMDPQSREVLAAYATETQVADEPIEYFGDILSQYERAHSQRSEEGKKGLEGTVIAVSPTKPSYVAAISNETISPSLSGSFFEKPWTISSLTDAQIATLGRWLEDGSLEGNAADLPAAPRFASGWQAGEPDLVVTLPP